MDVRSLDGKTALVTGAGSGIGRASALAFARRGADLVICDVNEGGLAKTEQDVRELGRRVYARRVDVGSEREMGAFAEAVHDDVEAIDLLLNNAGVGLGASMLETSLDDWRWVVQTNLFGVVHGCHFFVPPMLRRGRGGHVVNISSMAGYLPLPAQGAYAATKFGVLGLSQTLRAELRSSRVGVTAICPGFINTNIPHASRLRGIAADPEIKRRTLEFFRRRNYSPERVAEAILHAVQRDRAVAPVGVEAWVGYYAMRLTPGLLRFVTGKVAALGNVVTRAPKTESKHPASTVAREQVS